MYLIRKEGKQSCLSGWLPPHETRAQGPCEVGGQDLKRGRVEPQPQIVCVLICQLLSLTLHLGESLSSCCWFGKGEQICPELA